MAFPPFPNKHLSLSQTTLIQIFIIFLLVVGIVITIHTHEQVTEFKEHIWAMHDLSVDSLEKSIKLHLAGYQIYDESLNERVKNIFLPFNEAYQKSGGTVDDIDLESVRRKTSENPDLVDLYILNSSDVIIASTNKNELFLDFRNSAPLFADYLDDIRNKSGFFPDQVTSEMLTHEMRKWAYMPTPDHQYILETGLKDSSFTKERHLYINITDSTRDATHSNPYIMDIILWDFLGKKESSSVIIPGVNLSPDIRIQEMFQKDNSSFLDVIDDLPERDLVLVKSKKSQYGYDSSLVFQIDWNYPLIKQEILKIYGTMVGLFFLVAFISGIILYLTISRISRPIHDIIEDISQISNGNMDHPIRKTGISELSNLSETIEKMKESILHGRLEKSNLLEINKNLNDIIDSIPDPILIIDTEHRIIGWNNAMKILTGFSRKQMMNAGKEAYSSLFYGDNKNLLANMIIDSGLSHQYPEYIKKSDKILTLEGWVNVSQKEPKKYLSVVAAPVFHEDGSIFAAIETIRDISSVKKIEEALRTSEEKYRVLVENTKDIIFTLNQNGEFVFVSSSCEKYIGFTVEKVIGHHYRDFWYPDDISVFDEAFQSVMKTGSISKQLISRGKHPDGSWKWYSTFLSPIHDGNGAVIQISGISRNITSQKRTEDALKLALHKLKVLHSITSHDVKNQLRNILGFLYFDRNELTDPEQIRRNQIEQDSCLSILNHIEFSHVYQDIGKNEPVWNSVFDNVQSVCKQINLSNITVICDISGFELFADSMFVKVLYALFENSIRHGRKVTEIILTVEDSEDCCSLVYSDNGIGIKDSEKDLIFNHGYGKNTGIGLFLSREILSLTGITIIECGIFGEGVRFEIKGAKGLFRWISSN